MRDQVDSFIEDWELFPPVQKVVSQTVPPNNSERYFSTRITVKKAIETREESQLGSWQAVIQS